jgi:hypothetical protein
LDEVIERKRIRRWLGSDDCGVRGEWVIVGEDGKDADSRWAENSNAFEDQAGEDDR